METHKLDILLISETHFTKKNYFNVTNFNFYHTMHPDGTHGGNAILIKNNIRHFATESHHTKKIQAINIIIED